VDARSVADPQGPGAVVPVVRDEEAMRPWYEDFAERYGLLLGPATIPGWLNREAVAA